jgi:hypothetical protein
MGSQHVHDYVGAKLPQVVGANNGIPRIVYQIESRLVFDQIAHSFAIFECPLHVCDQSGAHLICGASRVERVLPHFKHPILIEPAIRKIRLVPIAKFHLTALRDLVHIYSGRFETLHVVPAELRIDHMEHLFSSIESLFDERQ